MLPAFANLLAPDNLVPERLPVTLIILTIRTLTWKDHFRAAFPA
jgi:hypothetical protein